MTRLLILSMGSLLLGFSAPELRAQASRLSPAATTRCDSVIKIVRSRQNQLKRRQALRYMRSCKSAGARAMANIIDDSHGMTDISALTAQNDAIAGWRDSSLFASAMSLVQDQSATDESRVFAIRYLLTVIMPELEISYASLTATLDSTVDADGQITYSVGCSPQLMYDRLTVSDTPPPSNYATQIRNLLSGLANNQSAPVAVQRAAGCIDVVP